MIWSKFSGKPIRWSLLLVYAITAVVSFWSGQSARADIWDIACNNWDNPGFPSNCHVHPESTACSYCGANCQHEDCTGCGTVHLARGCTHQPCAASNCWQSCY
jgi:hypothetical protein